MHDTSIEIKIIVHTFDISEFGHPHHLHFVCVRLHIRNPDNERCILLMQSLWLTLQILLHSDIKLVWIESRHTNTTRPYSSQLRKLTLHNKILLEKQSHKLSVNFQPFI